MTQLSSFMQNERAYNALVYQIGGVVYAEDELGNMIGTPSTTHSTVINAAITDIPSGGGRLYIREGTYDLSATIATKTGLEIVGDGVATILKPANSTDINAITISGDNDVVLRDFKIDGNGANQTGATLAGVSVGNSVNRVIMERLTIVSCRTRGISIDSATAADIAIRRCHITACGIDASVSGNGIIVRNGLRVTIDGCYVADIVGASKNGQGITVGSTATTSEGHIIVNNTCYSNDRYGISVGNCSETVIANNVCQDNGSAGQTGSGIVLAATAANHSISVIGNICMGNTTSGGGIAPDMDNYTNMLISDNICSENFRGINTTDTTVGGTGLVIKDNICIGNDREGIFINLITDFIISGNLVKNNGTATANTYNGIQCTSCTQGIVSNNRCSDDAGASGDQKNGIEFVTAATGILCTDNDVTGNRTAGIVPISGVTVRNNLGYLTENSGTGSIDNGATTDVITHGLAYTPTAAEISITLTENPTNTPGAIWVDTIGATTFTVNCENDPGASNLDFSWSVRRI